MIGVGVPHVGPDYSIPSLALEALLDVSFGKPPKCLARSNTEQQIVLVVARYRLAVFRLLRHVPETTQHHPRHFSLALSLILLFLMGAAEISQLHRNDSRDGV